MSILKNTLLASLLIFPAALSAEQITAVDATSVANFFLEEGFEPIVETDNVGDPLIKIEYYGLEFSIYYYGCTDGGNCDAIQFYKGYKTDGGVRLSKLNQWNAENRYALAYNSKEGSARIEHDIFLGDTGMTVDDFAGLVGKWSSAVKEFEDFINW